MNPHLTRLRRATRPLEKGAGKGEGRATLPRAVDWNDTPSVPRFARDSCLGRVESRPTSHFVLVPPLVAQLKRGRGGHRSREIMRYFVASLLVPPFDDKRTCGRGAHVATRQRLSIFGRTRCSTLKGAPSPRLSRLWRQLPPKGELYPHLTRLRRATRPLEKGAGKGEGRATLPRAVDWEHCPPQSHYVRQLLLGRSLSPPQSPSATAPPQGGALTDFVLRDPSLRYFVADAPRAALRVIERARGRMTRERGRGRMTARGAGRGAKRRERFGIFLLTFREFVV